MLVICDYGFGGGFAQVGGGVGTGGANQSAISHQPLISY
jgi:hypothetical protein